ncbi:MAG: serine/threonine-protein kinase [Acidobacteriota bacterium]
MTWLSDDAVERLRSTIDEPDFSGTRYRIVGEIGRGGMGVVYEAEDVDLQRRVAVKVLAADLADAGGDRVRREARVLAGLEHPGIVPVHDVGVLPDGRVFYAMKLVRGVTVGEFLRGAHGAAAVLRVFLRICEAVAFAHAKGSVHCDLKPQNVMVGEFGEVLVVDWGVARSRGDAAVRASGGTHGFMAPEQEAGAAVDARTDVYALGVMLRTLAGDARNKRLEAICAKAAAANPDHRYESARELGADVAGYLDGEAITAYRETALERAGRWLDRNRALIAVVAAYLIMRAIILLFVHR